MQSPRVWPMRTEGGRGVCVTRRKGERSMKGERGVVTRNIARVRTCVRVRVKRASYSKEGEREMRLGGTSVRGGAFHKSIPYAKSRVCTSRARRTKRVTHRPKLHGRYSSCICKPGICRGRAESFEPSGAVSLR